MVYGIRMSDIDWKNHSNECEFPISETDHIIIND